jgi:hypothetical protein
MRRFTRGVRPLNLDVRQLGQSLDLASLVSTNTVSPLLGAMCNKSEAAGGAREGRGRGPVSAAVRLGKQRGSLLQMLLNLQGDPMLPNLRWSGPVTPSLFRTTWK